MLNRNKFFAVLIPMLIAITIACSKKTTTPVTPDPVDTVPTVNEIDYWLTKGDASVLLTKQSGILGFVSNTNNYGTITVDSNSQYQTVDGFGYTLTDGSATLINGLPAATKQNLLQELFSNTGLGVSYLRISLGASDLSANTYSYNDLPAGATDVDQNNFDLQPARVDLIPILKSILLINPNIKILASPWSAPVWMKTNGNTMGGELQPQYYGAYAKYFVKYIQQMKAEGINIDAVTVQNEPQHGGNNPSMVMSADQQRDFIKNALGPAFQAASITTKIIVWDHNCDNSNYPISILNDAAAKQYIDGSAFHLYNGDIGALSAVHDAHPDKALYFTEQWTGANGSFAGDLQWHVKNVVIGSMRNWSRNALEWNLAADQAYNPHTVGGCTECKGALTISGTNVYRNVSYYIIGHASKFVPAGSKRIASNLISNVYNAAFVTPSGKKVLIAVNES
ncbi:MAG: hypothetical protein RLY16_3020, partial [Bacteroidota bacterium]